MVLLAAGGFDPYAAGRALVSGSVGSPAAFSVTATRAVPLALAGLGVALAFRAGVWNIGAEGQIYVGATAGVWIGLLWAGPASRLPLLAAPIIVLGLIAASVAGGLWALAPAYLRGRGVNEVVTTILLNFVAVHLVSFLVSGPLQEGRGIFQQTDELPRSLQLPMLVPETRVHVGVLVALAAAVALWAVYRWAGIGFRVRAVGAAPEVAASAGRMNVLRIGTGAFLVSGALAGLAGGLEIFGVTYALYSGLSPGWGYTAIAVAILGGLRPFGVLLAAFFFGALEAGGAAMQREAGVPHVWVSVVVATVILATLAGKVASRKLEDRATPESSSGSESHPRGRPSGADSAAENSTDPESGGGHG